MANDQDDSDILKPGELLDDLYRIEEELGRGGIGVVYKAFDLLREEYVAVKLLHDKWAKDNKMVKRFEREGRTAIRARHPNIVQIYAMGRRKGSGAPYLVMEYIEGELFLHRLRNARDRGVRIGMKGFYLARQMASVLAAAHAKGIIHRDLKPPNILIIRDADVVGGERIKLLDFGIAKMFTSEEDDIQTTVGGQQPGTPTHMPPEQFRPLDKKADPTKMDVWALGVLIYQMLAGRLPFWSPDPTGLAAIIMSLEPESLAKIDSTLPAPAVQLVHEMLNKDPSLRPTMEQSRERIDEFMGLKQPLLPEAVWVIRPTIEIDAVAPPLPSEA